MQRGRRSDLDFERAAVYRDRLAALSHVQSHQGINPQSRRGGRRLRHPPGGRPDLRPGVLLPHRPELGQPRLFPAAPTRRSSRREVLGAFLAQFYDDKPVPAADPAVARRSRSRTCWPRRSPTQAGHKVTISVPQRGEKKDLVDHALQNAREALGRRLAETSTQARAARRPRRDLRPADAAARASRSTTTPTSWAPTPSAP